MKRYNHNQFSITKFRTLLVSLVSSIIITGVSFLDGMIWNVIFIIIGEIAYAIVGLLITIGVLRGRKNSRDAYSFIIVLLILGGYAIYKVLLSFKLWVLSWPLFVKILVPLILLFFVIGTIVLFALHKKGYLSGNNKRHNNTKEENTSDSE